MRCLATTTMLLAGLLPGQQTLSANTTKIDLPAGGQQVFSLAAAGHGWKSYAMFGTLSGTTPGTRLGPLLVPLNYDPWTGVTIAAANSPSLVNFRGRLDLAGRGRATLVVPKNAPSSAIGLTFHHAFVVYDTAGTHYMASNPVPLTIGGRKPLDVAAFFAENPVVDGNVNYYSPTQSIGANDFTKDIYGRSVKQATGIDFGAITLKSMASLQAQVRNFSSGTFKGARLILRAADFDTALKNNEYGALAYCQHHFPLNGSIQPIASWYSQGLRIVQLQYSAGDPNQGPLEKLGGGKGQTGGLTTLGTAVVYELIRLNMVIDLSHVNPQTTLETCAIARSKGVPVTANHTCAQEVKNASGQKIADYARNITDAEIKAIRDTGGVVGVMAYAPYLIRPGIGKIDDYIAHVEHVVKVAGIDHVAVSTDGYLDGTMPNNVKSDGILDSPTRWLEVGKRLDARGYSETDLQKLFGGNLLRVYKKILK